jgi:hypothetical protein
MLILTDKERLSNTIFGYISCSWGYEVGLVATEVNSKIHYLHDQIRKAEQNESEYVQ